MLVITTGNVGSFTVSGRSWCSFSHTIFLAYFSNVAIKSRSRSDRVKSVGVLIGGEGGIHVSVEAFHKKRECLTLAERIEGAMTAEKLAKLLGVSKITIFKQAKAGRIPSLRIDTCVRFDPKAVANWLRRV